MTEFINGHINEIESFESTIVMTMKKILKFVFP